MSTLVDCVCQHAEYNHIYWSETNLGFKCNQCLCNKYEPNGANPTLNNILCPSCSKARLEYSFHRNVYFCVACFDVFSNEQVKYFRKGDQQQNNEEEKQ